MRAPHAQCAWGFVLARECNGTDKGLGYEAVGGVLCAASACVVLVKRDEDASFVGDGLDNEAFLGCGKCVAHGGDNVVSSLLGEFKDREESFYHDEAVRCVWCGAVEVVEFRRFVEVRRQEVFGFALRWISRITAGVGNEFTMFIVDRDCYAAFHHAAIAVADAKMGNGLVLQASLFEVWM